MNNIDPQEELQRILSEEISKSIDAQIMNDLKPYIRESKIDTILSKLEEDTNASE
jgi:rRNA-processing protein FCF1